MEMKISKKQMIIAAIVIGAIAVWYFFIRKKKIESSYGPDFGAYGSYGNESGYGPANEGQICAKDRQCGPGLICSNRRCIRQGKTNTTGGGATMGGGAGGPRPNTSTATVADGAIPIPVKPMTTSATAMVDPNAVTVNPTVGKYMAPALKVAIPNPQQPTYGNQGF